MSGVGSALTTWEEFVQLPDEAEGMHYELHDGEVVIVPPRRALRCPIAPVPQSTFYVAATYVLLRSAASAFSISPRASSTAARSRGSPSCRDPAADVPAPDRRSSLCGSDSSRWSYRCARFRLDSAHRRGVPARAPNRWHRGFSPWTARSEVHRGR